MRAWVVPCTPASGCFLGFNSSHPRGKRLEAPCHLKRHHESFPIQFPHPMHGHASRAVSPFPDGQCGGNRKWEVSSCSWHPQLFDTPFPGQTPLLTAAARPALSKVLASPPRVSAPPRIKRNNLLGLLESDGGPPVGFQGWELCSRWQGGLDGCTVQGQERD